MLQAYAIPAMEVKLKLARANLPPHTIMRGPGYLQAVMVIEQVCYCTCILCSVPGLLLPTVLS